MKKNINFSLIFLLLATANWSYGQSNYFDYETLKNEHFSFPVFIRESDPNTTKYINQMLQLSELELLYGYQKKNIFENVNINNGSIYGGKTDISFEILANNPKLLSIKFIQASSGISCFYWLKYYNFNSGNGDLVQLKDLFTPEGFVLFKENVFIERNEKFCAEYEYGENCYVNDISDILEYLESEDFEDYFIQDTCIYIDGNGCLHKNDKFCGWDMIVKFNLSRFRNYLNDFGKTVFGISPGGVEKYYSNELPQLFEGSVGGSNKILLILKPTYANNVIGIYTYLKNGKGINLTGEIINNELKLKELNDDLKETAYINAYFDGKNIIGTWTNKKKTKKLKFVAKRK